ncbi:MAG: hypothetical protein JST68_20520 [Bacteroidetes bacterium]|nr:hypothetical protein [Bacteroidota bacterium]
MRKKILLLMIPGLLMVLVSFGQLNLVLQVPPLGVMQKAQLWNMALVYTGNSATVSIQLTLVSAKDNQPVMTARTRAVFLTKGTTVVTPREVAPVRYDYLSPAFTDRDPNGFLPAGNYKACYTVITSDKGAAALAEECIPIEVQPLSPPQLVTPADKDTIQTPYPQFSWIPPAPLNIFSNLNFDLIMVEVLPGQATNEAIQQNIPVYTMSRYKDMVHLYPASGRRLDTGRVYAWRIIAKNEGEFIDESDVWTFRLATPKKDSVVIPYDSYIPLRRSNEQAIGVRTITNGLLAVRYYSYAKDHDTTVSFYGQDGQVIRSVTRKVLYGENFWTFKIDGAFEKKKVYRVEVIDERSYKNTASFTIQ